MPFYSNPGSGMSGREVLALAISRVEALDDHRLIMDSWSTCAFRAVAMTTPEIAGIGLSIAGMGCNWPVAYKEHNRPAGAQALALCFEISEEQACQIFFGPPFGPITLTAREWAGRAREVLGWTEKEPA